MTRWLTWGRDAHRLFLSPDHKVSSKFLFAARPDFLTDAQTSFPTVRQAILHEPLLVK